jgi:asparagine synthase (glutamine-hydrolysing)
MLTSMMHEAFYTSGEYAVPAMGIYLGWITQKDSFADGQVFFNQAGDVALILSGECFLDSDTAALLQVAGNSVDANKGNWLVQLYLERGERFVEQLNGLFSGLLVDQRCGKAFLFNDRYGMERIYIHKDRNAFYFASEAKALLRILPQLRKFDQEGLAQFFSLGCTIGSRTLFEGVERMPPASWWCFEGGVSRKQTYFSPQKLEAQPAESEPDFGSAFEETFNRILPRYVQSKSKLGISLTAGLDGRMIMACLPQFSQKPVCYTFSGQRQDTLDARLAARVAQACGIEHQVLRIESDFLSDFASHADRTIYTTDGCLGVLGAHELYMNKRARSLAPVRLTGVFGGEILREVSFAKPLRLAPGLLNSEWKQREAFFSDAFRRNGQNRLTFALSNEIPLTRFGVIAAGRSQTIFRTPYLDNELVALAYRTPPNLRSSFVPALLLIKHNCEALSKIPTDMGLMGDANDFTAAARRIVSKVTFKLDYFYNEGLPHRLSHLDPVLRKLNSEVAILGLHKFLHYRSWFQRELAEYVSERLTEASKRQSYLWNGIFLREIASDHKAGRKNYVTEINTVLTLESIERLLFRAPSVLDQTTS